MNHKLKNERFRRRLVSILSCIVVFCTTYALILPAVTLERDDIVYYCGKEEHQHTDECYESPKDKPLCGLKDGEMVDGHVHDESCYKTEMVLDCLEDHEHTDECYKEEKTLVCDKEEGAQEHKHSSKCFLSTEPLCGKEVHTHSRECESNKSLKETKEDWEHSIPAKLKDTAAERMVQIALSQKDYKEVKENFELNEEGHEQYYTRYGEWYGRPYEDWNVMFVSFVLRYAGIKNEQIPYGHDWNEWIEDLTKKQLFADEGYLPKDGDLIFIKDKEDENVPDKEIRNYAGIVTDIENRKIVVGDLDGQVKEITLDDKEYETNAYVAMIESDAKDDVLADKEENDDNETNEEERPDEETGKEEANEEETDPIEFRMPEQFEIENEDFTLTLTPRVFDEDVQEENQEQTEEDSEETNEEGLKIKKFSLNEENIQDKIDAENELTKEELEQIAQANEEQKKEDEDKPLLTVQLEKIDEQTQTSEEEQAEIEQLKEQSLENVDQDNLLDLSFYKLRFFANDQEVDLKDQKFDAELTPTQKFVDECDVKEEFPDAAPEAEVGYYLQVVQPGAQVPSDLVSNQTNTVFSSSNVSESTIINTNDSSILINEKYDGKSLNAVLQANHSFARIQSRTSNAHFFVQTYGYIEKHVETTNNTQLPLVDMSEGIPETYAHGNTKVKYYQMENGVLRSEIPKDNNGNKIPTKLFREKDYYYHKAPNLQYFNILRENASYQLEEVWILKDEVDNLEKDKDERLNNWEIYDISKNEIHFTNNESAAKDEDGIVYVPIKDNTVIRLVYSEKTKSDKGNNAYFYDYDITDGNRDGIQMNSSDDNPPRTYVTYKNGISQGINKNVVDQNYNQLVFGNNTTNAGYDPQYDNAQHNAQTINKGEVIYINENGNKARLGGAPIFGMLNSFVKNSAGSYSLNFNNINAPDLFSQKSYIDGRLGNYNGQLKFKRSGDLHKLTSVSGSKLKTCENLENFHRKQGYTDPEKPDFHGTYFWQNNFWPLDTQDIKGQIGGSPLNAKYSERSGEFPKADDSKNHNAFFGMAYEVNYTIVEDYEGPLEYFFNGDDDMWVFIDGILVCDLGGIHQTRGGYVDIRKFCETQKITQPLAVGEHTMTVFYLERGQSGSTCYMEYRLPSTTSDEIIRDTGHLKIQKLTNDDSGETYHFNVKLKDKNGLLLKDDYSYSKYGKNGNILEQEIILKNGETIIPLKSQEYAEIYYLPPGTEYEITEILDKNEATGMDNNFSYHVSAGATQETNLGFAEIYDPDSDQKKYVITSNGLSPNDDLKKQFEPIEVGKIKEVYFRNSRYYQLPETGSLGIDPPLIAGSAGVMTTSFYALTLKRKGRWRKRKR